MSFWSFLGLADRSDMNALSEEIRLLREENSRLLNEQKLLTQRQIQGLKADNQHISEECLNLLTQRIQEHSTATSQELEACCTLLLEEIRRLGQENHTLIKAQDTVLQNGLRVLSETSHQIDQQMNQLNALIKQCVSLFQNQAQIMNYLANICQDADQFLDIQKSINHLWEIMKVVWVDSLLKDLNDSETK